MRWIVLIRAGVLVPEERFRLFLALGLNLFDLPRELDQADLSQPAQGAPVRLRRCSSLPIGSKQSRLVSGARRQQENPTRTSAKV